MNYGLKYKLSLADNTSGGITITLAVSHLGLVSKVSWVQSKINGCFGYRGKSHLNTKAFRTAFKSCYSTLIGKPPTKSIVDEFINELINDHTLNINKRTLDNEWKISVLENHKHHYIMLMTSRTNVDLSFLLYVPKSNRGRVSFYSTTVNALPPIFLYQPSKQTLAYPYKTRTGYKVWTKAVNTAINRYREKR